MEMLTNLIRFFQAGGPFMVPIALVLAIGLAIALERYLYLGSVMRANRRDYKALLPLLDKGRIPELLKRTQTPGSAVSLVFKEGLARMETTRRRQDVEYAMEEGLLETLPAIEKRTPYLATFANIATLLGLLGTIIGLIAAFTAVANADPAEKATLLSQSISIAMNTTAFGLMAAIPLLLVHAYLQGKTKSIIESLDIAIVKFLNFADGQKPTVG
jgi:biopolymer transport protein ExbB